MFSNWVKLVGFVWTEGMRLGFILGAIFGSLLGTLLTILSLKLEAIVYVVIGFIVGGLLGFMGGTVLGLVLSVVLSRIVISLYNSSHRDRLCKTWLQVVAGFITFVSGMVVIVLILGLPIASSLAFGFLPASIAAAAAAHVSKKLPDFYNESAASTAPEYRT